MVERGRDPRLAQEALAEALVLGELGGDHLERDLAPEALLVGTVDRTHPPAADERFDPVAGDRRSGRQHGARDVAHRSSVWQRSADCNTASASCVTTVTLATSRARTTRSDAAPYSRAMTDRTRREHTMKRIATIASRDRRTRSSTVGRRLPGTSPRRPKPQTDGTGHRRPGRQGPARRRLALTVQRHLVQIAHAKRFSLLPPADPLVPAHRSVWGRGRGPQRPLSRALRARRCRPGEPGRASSSRPVASRSAATIAAVETTVGGSPTPFTPYGASGSGPRSSSETTGGMSRNVGMR